MGEMRGKCWTPAKKTPHRTTHKPRTTLVVPNRPPGHSCPAQTNVIRERKAEIQRMKNSNVFHHWGRPGITPRTKTVASALARATYAPLHPKNTAFFKRRKSV